MGACGGCKLCMGFLKSQDNNRRQPKMSNNSEPTTALESLGKIGGAKEARDAIHLAVVNVEAGEKLFPSQHIGLADGVGTATANELIGIVDPFLPSAVNEGQKFWMVLYPRTITSLRHVWEHPSFGSSSGADTQQNITTVSEEWLREYAQQIDEPFGTLINAAEAFIEYEEYFLGDEDEWGMRGKFEGERVPDEFWGHYENYTGTKVPSDKKHSFFSCSC